MASCGRPAARAAVAQAATTRRPEERVPAGVQFRPSAPSAPSNERREQAAPPAQAPQPSQPARQPRQVQFDDDDLDVPDFLK